MEIGDIQKTIDRFNICIPVGTPVAYYPGRADNDLIIHREGKRTYTKSKAFAKASTAVVVVAGVGNVDVRNVVSGKTCSLDPIGFSKTFEHRW